MGKMKQLWQDQRDARWQQHFDDYCRDNFGGGEPNGSRAWRAAEDYADDMMEQEDTANGQFGVGA